MFSHSIIEGKPIKNKEHDTKFKIGECLIQMTVGTIWSFVVLIGGNNFASLAGWSYFLPAPA